MQRQQQECGVPCEGQNRAGPGSWVTDFDGAFADVRRMLACRLDDTSSSRILEDHSTDNTREAFAASCRKFPGLTGRIVCVSPYTKLTPTMWWSA
jgi:hypothetical protein